MEDGKDDPAADPSKTDRTSIGNRLFDHPNTKIDVDTLQALYTSLSPEQRTVLAFIGLVRDHCLQSVAYWKKKEEKEYKADFNRTYVKLGTGVNKFLTFFERIVPILGPRHVARCSMLGCD